jgi:adenosylmethionine-8-amino-7-oxononanoate aminotransferase
MVTYGFRQNCVLEDGTNLYDAFDGAAAASLSKVQEYFINAIVSQLKQGVSYVPSLALGTPVADELAQSLVESTGGKMEKAVLYCSCSPLFSCLNNCILTII